MVSVFVLSEVFLQFNFEFKYESGEKSWEQWSKKKLKLKKKKVIENFDSKKKCEKNLPLV